MPFPGKSSPTERAARRQLLLLLAVAAILFTSNANRLSLPSLDDCFYARKGVEMHQRGAIFDITWNGRPNFQDPPAHFWLLARSFGMLGYNDVAARVPSILMAWGILLGIFYIGEKTVGREASLTAISLLLLSPYFINNARRCMLEVPLTFWVVMAMVVFVRAMGRPRAHLLICVPLAAAMLTKSLLGLVIVIIFGGTIALSQEARRMLDKRWLVIGTTMGILLGLSWSLYLALHYGWDALREHYVKEILSRSSAEFDLRRFFLDYPSILFRDFQIVILPAVFGTFELWRRRDLPRWFVACLLVWLIAFPMIINFSSARTARYIFPIVPALALSGGYWLERRFNRFSKHFYSWMVPSLAVLAAAVFWVHPSTLTRDRNAAMKNNAALIRELVPPTEPIPYLGGTYWVVANPLMYYADRELALPSSNVQTATKQTLESSSRLLFCAPEQLAALSESGHSFAVVLEADQWLLLRMESRIS